MSRPGRDFDSDYDVEDDEEPSSAESDDSYDPEMPSTPKARRRPAAPPRGRGRSGGAAAPAGDQRRYALRPAREDTSDSDGDSDGDGALDRAETILETGRGRLRGANRRLRFDDDDDDEEEEEAAAPEAPEPDDDDDDGGGDECAICFEAITARDGFTTACAHQFHASCVAAMRAAAAGGASRCPMCRAAFPAVVSDALDRGARRRRARDAGLRWRRRAVFGDAASHWEQINAGWT
ncbi:hypothetical protein JL722_3906 [Aureococcus anophagefferens]|nr:hypothetical protein JL722_3906 [Aureococcus anophagefferens]